MHITCTSHDPSSICTVTSTPSYVTTLHLLSSSRSTGRTPVRNRWNNCWFVAPLFRDCNQGFVHVPEQCNHIRFPNILTNTNIGIYILWMHNMLELSILTEHKSKCYFLTLRRRPMFQIGCMMSLMSVRGTICCECGQCLINKHINKQYL